MQNKGQIRDNRVASLLISQHIGTHETAAVVCFQFTNTRGYLDDSLSSTDFVLPTSPSLKHVTVGSSVLYIV